eukprot:m.52900 g.52900  ORF g.52900 m.52900 type:complete len:185 (-) comp13110_c0_seq2:206-760(-)
MFKKFGKEDVSSTSLVKTSVARGIRAKLLEQMPLLESILPVIMPKKSPLYQVKCKDHIVIYASLGRFLFFQHYDGPFFPTLRLLHEYPMIMTVQQVDKGAIKFVLKGADIMCPGVTSKGGKLNDADEGDAVCVMAEGMQHALGLGQMKMSSANVRTINKDVGIINVHFLNDGLWNFDSSYLNIK